MSLNKKTRKNLIIASVTAVLVVGFALGLWFFVQYQSDQKTVEVQPVSYLSTSYWGDTTYSSGTAASDSTQEIYPSTEQTISDIYVTEGQQVSVGDPLLQYDKTKLELEMPGGVLIGNPIPDEYAMDFDYMEGIITKALELADAQHIHGKEITPFLLAHIKELTGGESFASNVQLALNNARCAARIAVSLAKM